MRRNSTMQGDIANGKHVFIADNLQKSRFMTSNSLYISKTKQYRAIV